MSANANKTNKELIAELEALGVSIPKRANKATLLELLRGSDSGAASSDVATTAAAEPSSCDLIGSDGRRILRGVSDSGCRDLQKKILSSTGEKTTIVTASGILIGAASEPGVEDGD